MGVEDEAGALSASGYHADGIDALLGDELKKCVDAALLEPIDDRFADLSFLGVGACGVSQPEAEVDQFLTIFFDDV